jgi:hypothetical protein
LIGELEVDIFASRLNYQLKKIVSWKPDPMSLATDAFLLNWTKIKGYAPILFNREMSCQSEEREIHNNSDSPNLASSILLFDSVTDVNSRSYKAPNLPGISTIPARESAPTDREQQSNSRGLENLFGGDSTTKLSKTAADLHQQAWRPGTQIAY